MLRTALAIVLIACALLQGAAAGAALVDRYGPAWRRGRRRALATLGESRTLRYLLLVLILLIIGFAVGFGLPRLFADATWPQAGAAPRLVVAAIAAPTAPRYA